jgi:hypothetical protein
MTDDITARMKLDAAERELRFRHGVYPRQVMKGAMTQKTADLQIAIMQAIVNDYRELALREGMKHDATLFSDVEERRKGGA